MTEEPRRAVAHGKAVRNRSHGPEYVLLRADIYETRAEEKYDAGPWTEEEMIVLAAEAGAMLDAFGKNA